MKTKYLTIAFLLVSASAESQENSDTPESVGSGEQTVVTEDVVTPAAQEPASSAAPPSLPGIATFDTDGDGRLSMSEFGSMRAEHNKIIKADMEKRGASGEAIARTLPESLAKFDADGDGSLSQSEREVLRADVDTKIKEKLAKRISEIGNPELPEKMKQFDVDADGKLSQEEFTSMRAAHEEKMKEDMAKRAASGEQVNKDFPQGLKTFDANGDGKLSYDEIAASIKAKFAAK